MANEFFYVCPRNFQVFSRIELVGMFNEELSDRARHRKAYIRVDIDFSYGKFGGFAKLIFGYAYRVGHFAAEFVDHRNVFLRNG